MLFADCALVVDPTAEQLADIAIATTQSAKQLLERDPSVAMLSFSTNGSANHPFVDKVREATGIVRKIHPELAIDGDIQLDAALHWTAQALALKDSMDPARADIVIAELTLGDTFNLGVDMAAVDMPSGVGDTVVQGASLSGAGAGGLMSAIQEGMFPQGITVGLASGTRLVRVVSTSGGSAAAIPSSASTTLG